MASVNPPELLIAKDYVCNGALLKIEGFKVEYTQPVNY